MKVEDMKGGYTTGSCATAGMKAGLLALLDKNIVDQVVIENPQGQYIEVPIKAGRGHIRYRGEGDRYERRR